MPPGGVGDGARTELSMEGLFFLADIILMLLLAIAIFRGERGQASEDLGLFAYKSDEGQVKQSGSREEERRDA